MKKIILSFSITLLFCSYANAENKEKALNQMTNEELIAKIMQLDKEEQEADKRIVKARAKTQALEKLEKKVDELSKILHVDK